jgi:hypothetical protein
MTKEAGLRDWSCNGKYGCLQRLIELVRADEREQIIATHTKEEALRTALKALELNNSEWKSLADSGDCGFWRAEDQNHYKQTKEAITAIKQALAAVPDAITDNSESPEYIQGWNDCRALMLEMRKP